MLTQKFVAFCRQSIDFESVSVSEHIIILFLNKNYWITKLLIQIIFPLVWVLMYLWEVWNITHIEIYLKMVSSNMDRWFIWASTFFALNSRIEHMFWTNTSITCKSLRQVLNLCWHLLRFIDSTNSIRMIWLINLR